MRVKRSYIFLIILAAVLWSVDGLLRRQLYQLPAVWVVFLEHIFRFSLLLPFASRFLKEYRRMKLRDWLIMIAIGLISGALATTLYTAALAKVQFISYSVVGLLQQTQPIFTILLAVLILKERLTRRYLILGSLAIIAAYFLAFPHCRPQFLHSQQELIAVLLAAGASFFWGLGTILSKLILTRLSYMATVILRFAIVIPIALIMALVTGQTYPLAAMTSSQWLNLLLIAFFSGAVSFVVYYKGLQYTEAKMATLAELAWPLSAAIIGYAYLGDRLTAVQLFAGAFLLVDILVLSLIKTSR